MASLFSKIISGDIPSHKLAEDEHYFAFLDICPMSKGHALVIPKREEDYIFDLTDQELSGILLFARKVAKAIEAVVDCKRIGISVVGLEVPHAHVHLIPINSVADMTFMKEPVAMSQEELAELAASIREHMSS
jgi:histidine triad (HIT) family protein